MIVTSSLGADSRKDWAAKWEHCRQLRSADHGVKFPCNEAMRNKIILGGGGNVGLEARWREWKRRWWWFTFF